jgi:hypothetical protein
VIVAFVPTIFVDVRFVETRFVAVAVPVALMFPAIVWPFNVVEASDAEVVAVSVPNIPADEVRFCVRKLLVKKFVVVALVSTKAVPVAFANVVFAKDARPLTDKNPAVEMFADESPPANVDVPAPAATVIAPPNVDVAVDVDTM